MTQYRPFFPPPREIGDGRVAAPSAFACREMASADASRVSPPLPSFGVHASARVAALKYTHGPVPSYGVFVRASSVEGSRTFAGQSGSRCPLYFGISLYSSASENVRTARGRI